MNKNSLSLLLVDDEDGIRLVMSVLLNDLGYNVILAERGDKALSLYEELRPDIVISDIKMPGLDGISLLKAIKALDADAEILLLTGHGDMELAVAGLQNGAGDFLNKPVSDAALTVALERACKRIHIRERLRRHTEELEKLVTQRTAELVQSERFAAVGESAASLAHTIKNIAGALEGTMYILEKGLELNKREYFEQGWQMIRGDVSRLRTLAMRLLDLGRPTELVFAPVSPAKPAMEVLHSLKQKALEAKISLDLVDEAGPEPFTMAEEAVHQCIFNLALNALEAFPPETRRVVSPKVLITIRRERLADGDMLLEYCIADNGPGLPDTVNENSIFHSGKTEGNGIGLFSTRKAIHEMGGELKLVSKHNHGTEAYLQLYGSWQHT